LADLGLIDEYEFLVLPVVAGHGPTLFAGLSERLDLKLVDRQEFRSGGRRCVTSPLDARRDDRLPFGTRDWQLRHNAEIDTGVPRNAGSGCISTCRPDAAHLVVPETRKWQRLVNSPRAAQRSCPSLCRIRLFQVKGAG
jgi:hypothetical protein